MSGETLVVFSFISTSPAFTLSPAFTWTSSTTPLVFQVRLAEGWASREPEASTVWATFSEVTVAVDSAVALLALAELTLENTKSAIRTMDRPIPQVQAFFPLRKFLLFISNQNLLFIHRTASPVFSPTGYRANLQKLCRIKGRL